MKFLRIMEVNKNIESAAFEASIDYEPFNSSNLPYKEYYRKGHENGQQRILDLIDELYSCNSNLSVSSFLRELISKLKE